MPWSHLSLPIISRLRRPLLLAGMVTTMCMTPVFANEVDDVSQLLRTGQHAAALNKADSFLRKNPRDAQMRFLRGVILTEQNKKAEAIDVFTRLTKDYPMLPEPYNNLAVLYASAGEYEKARHALDQAIRTNPAYATAYENLGDVHAKLASQAYDKALQLDHRNNTAQSKLTMVRSLVGHTENVAPPVAVASTPTVPSALPVVAPAEKEGKKQISETAEPTVAQVERKPEPLPAARPVEQIKQDIQQAEQKNAKEDEVARAEVLRAVESWAAAWSARDVGAYLHAYANDFVMPGGQSRKSWEAQRRARIEDKRRISVKITEPRITVDGDKATVHFFQRYDSDRLKSDSHKTLVLKKQGGAWRIQQERTGN